MNAAKPGMKTEGRAAVACLFVVWVQAGMFLILRDKPFILNLFKINFLSEFDAGGISGSAFWLAARGEGRDQAGQQADEDDSK